MKKSKFYALIPAAGKSRRMGNHKLLMSWNDFRVIDNVLNAWTSSNVLKTLVVVRNDDNELQEACSQWPVAVLKLENETRDMKESIQHGLTRIKCQWAPSNNDQCLIAPADLPRISTPLINRIIEAADGSKKIVAPFFGDKLGHPVCFPWPMTQAIFEMSADEGLDALIDRSETQIVKLDTESRVRDIDTPEDYRREKGCET